MVKSMSLKDYKYTAFISYRHVEPDATIAAALHQAIETFKVPKEFYIDGKAPSFRVFRDREELSASDLSDSIQAALQESYFLIVISSKRTPLSEWCTREVELFRRLHGDERIISVLIEGEPEEAFSQPLKELQKIIIDDAGEEQLAPRELLAADLRPEAIRHDFVGYESLQQTDPAQAKAYTKEALKLLKTEIYRIMAAILGCSYGDLKQRAKERRQRQIIQVSSFFAMLFLAFGLFMFNAYRKENIARRESIQVNSTLMLNRSQSLLAQGDRVKSLLVAKQAMHEVDASMERYERLKSQHEGILSEALFPVSASLRTRIPTGNAISFMDVNPEGDLVAVGLGNDQVGLFRVDNGERVAELSGHREQVKIVDFSENGKYLLSSGFDGQIILWDVAKHEIIKRFEHQGNPLLTRFYGNDEFLVAMMGPELMLYRYTDMGHQVEQVQLDRMTIDLKYDPEQAEFITLATPSAGEQIRRYSFKSGQWLANYPLPDSGDRIAPLNMLKLSEDGEHFYLGQGGSLIKLRRSDGSEVFRVDNRNLSDQVIIAEDLPNQRLFLINNTVVEERAIDNGELHSKNLFQEGVIHEIAYHSSSDTLALALENGKLALWRNGMTLDPGVDLKANTSSEMLFTASGDRLLVNAKSLKELLVLDVNSRSSEEPLRAQVLSSSALGKFSLLFSDGKFQVWDNQTKQVQHEVDSKNLGFPGSGYILDSLALVLSDDGRHVAYHDYRIGGSKREDHILLVDATTEQTTELAVPIGDYQLAFHPKREEIILAQPGEVWAMNFQGERLWDLVPGGLVQELRFSPNGDQIALNYMEGNAQIFDIDTQKPRQQLPGRVLWFDAEEQRGIYNRSVYISRGGEPEYHDLAAELDATPVSNADQYVYQAESDQLLILRNGLDKPVAYLLQFSTGHLRRSFLLPLTSYKAKAFFQQDGELVMDQAFYSRSLENADSSFEAYPVSMRFHFADYPGMLDQEALFLGERELSETERLELGLED